MITVLKKILAFFGIVIRVVHTRPGMWKNPHRPYCPQCGRELVFAAIIAGGEFFSAWLCDCNSQPEGVNVDIVRAREWDQQSIVYEVIEDPYDD